MNKVSIQTDDFGIGVVALNHIRLDGVQSVAYQRDQTGRPIVTLALVAELYQTDEEDLYRAERNAQARSEAELAALKSRLAAAERVRSGAGTVYTGFDVSPEDGRDTAALRELFLVGLSGASVSTPASDKDDAQRPTPARPGFYTEPYPTDVTISGAGGFDDSEEE